MHVMFPFLFTLISYVLLCLYFRIYFLTGCPNVWIVLFQNFSYNL
uniref:Uncharacterized protein n=1 Tax=Rhizophora mucronata TaxID=61149 RepID=A0A2P2KKU4_RHIMU